MSDTVDIILWQTRPDSWGACYECRDGLHKACIGIPCDCRKCYYPESTGSPNGR